MALALLLSAPAGAMAGQVPLDQDGFTSAVAARMKAAVHGGKVVVDGPLTLQVDGAAGPGTVGLDRIYQLCQGDKDDCDGYVDDFVAKMAAYHNTRPEPLKKAQLRVVVRPSDYVDGYRRVTAGHGDIVAKPLPGDLWVIGAADLPTTISMLNTEMLAPLKLSADEAIALGEKNLSDDVRRQVAAVMQQPLGGLAVLPGDPYASSALAMPELFQPLANKAGGDLLVAAPSADTLLVLAGGGDDGPKVMAKMAKIGLASAERPLSAAVFRWTDRGWVEVATRSHRRKASTD